MGLAGTRRSRSPEKDTPAKRNRYTRDISKEPPEGVKAAAFAEKVAASFRSPNHPNSVSSGKGKGKVNAPYVNLNPSLHPRNAGNWGESFSSTRGSSSSHFASRFKSDESVADTIIRATTPFAGTYKPRVGDFLGQAKPYPNFKGVDPTVAFSHLNCSYFEHRTKAPTLGDLKRHALSLTNLIYAHAGSMIGSATDWVRLVGTGCQYEDEDEAHGVPLEHAMNVVRQGVDGLETAGGKCPLVDGPLGIPGGYDELMGHANEILEIVDYRCAHKGGLLSLLPHPGQERRVKVEDTFVGQWMVYTSNLSMRVAQLEIEVENSRNVLAGEATAPWVLGRASFFGGGEGVDFGRELLFPQDRYVLSGLSQGLWERLDHKLLREAQRKTVVEESVATKVRGGRVKPGRKAGGDESAPAPPGQPLEPIAWVDIKSRVYRVKGKETMFVVLGHGGDLNPDTELTARLEKMPLISVLPHPVAGASTTAQDEEERTQQEKRTEASLIRALKANQALEDELKKSTAQNENLERQVNIKVKESLEEFTSLLSELKETKALNEELKKELEKYEDAPKEAGKAPRKKGAVKGDKPEKTSK
jgi:hypothetical protein